MHQEDLEFRRISSLDHDSALCEQQTVLLNRIHALTRDVTINNSSESKYIYVIRQEYNKLVKKRAELARSLLSDPMEVLPPDLWPDIIRNIVNGGQYPVNKLLDLISVSKGWCSVLTTLPVIWKQIWLNQREPDYLAKAMMCIRLSEECEIDLFIWDLTVDEWRGISSVIVPEGRRIRRLSFDIRDTDYMLIRQILGEFTELPVLQELSLPDRPSQLSDQEYIHALLTEKMPSIKIVNTPGCTMRDQIWNPYLIYCSLEAESFTKEAVETLMLLPHLWNLRFAETAQTLENIPSLLKSSFGSVRIFTYEGANICHRLTWIGNNLTTLSTHYPEDGNANALLVALSRFPYLHDLMITISSSSWGQPTQNNNHTAIPHNSIRVLSLETPIQNQYDADWDVFFSIFFPASPCLKNLSVQYGIITEMGWSSIQSIKNLRDLYIGMCIINDPSSILLNMESLRQFELIVRSYSLAQSLARLESKFLQTLRLTELQSYSRVATTPYMGAGDGTSLHTVTTTPYIVAGAAFPNITSLAVSTGTPVIWELGMLPKLRALEVNVHSFVHQIMYGVIDVLEAILIRPRDNPALEKITLTGDFIEWDILLLVLERRNFLNEPGVSSITTLVFDHDLPYRLLYPLSELLGGRFVERDSNSSFSVEAIGERMWNESIPGCMRCHYRFQECKSLLTPRRKTPRREAAGSDKESQLANEYLVADPPLPLEMARWLSGRRERRSNFMRRYEETGRQLHRPLWCDANRQYGSSVITNDVLVGAHFGHDLQEQNEVTERVYVEPTGYN